MGRDDVSDLDVAQVAGVLRDGWGLVAEKFEVMSGEVATVMRARVGTRSLAVKALPGSPTDAALLAWQTRIAQRLSVGGLPVPQTLPTKNGSLVWPSEVNGRQVFTTVAAWMTDPPLADIPDIDDALLTEVGATAARVSLALADAEPPPVPARHEWELIRSADSIRDALPRVHDVGLRELVAEVAQAHEQVVQPVLMDLPWSVVHHDLHDSNLLVGVRHGRRSVTGILDFGDMVEAPRIAECVVAAAYAARNVEDPVHAVEVVAEGWRQIWPLSAEERKVLLPAVCSRLAVNTAIWASRAGGSRGSYASRRSAGAVETLRLLLSAR